MKAWIISSSLLVLVIVVLRRILRGKGSLRLQYALWALVLLRLLLPFSLFDSSLSIMNLVGKGQDITLSAAADRTQDFEEIEYVPYIYEIPATSTDIGEIYTPQSGTVQGYYPGDSDHAFPTEILENATVEEFQQLERTMKARDILIPVWLSGTALFALYFLICNLRFGAALRRSRKEYNAPGSIIPVYVSGAVPTPCLFGLFRPAVYITSECENDPDILRHVLAHESTHYRHGDNIWAVLRCVILALHWYNPLVWWAAVLSKRDSELACDEGAIHRLGEEERSPYGRTLIGMTCRRSSFGSLARTATTMTDSKNGIRERIVLIAKKPKMAIYTLVAVLIIAAAAAVCTFTGANLGFTDAEARKEALGLAEAVAFENGLELANKPEILRYEGEVAEADPDTKLKYVKLSYPTKNSTRHIVVEFCMTDEKGQHHDEPFSAICRISMNLSTVVSPSSGNVDYVQLWKKGYPNPEVPDEYQEELKQFVTDFWYGEEYVRGMPDDASLNSEGFTVYLKDGGSVSFGLDYAEYDGVNYKLAHPELPDWLEEIFYSDELLAESYAETGVSVAPSLMKLNSAVIDSAIEVVKQDIEHLNTNLACGASYPEIQDIQEIQTGTAGQYDAVSIYELSYRVQVENIDKLPEAERERMNGNWLINGGFGTKYIVLLFTEFGVSHIGTLTDYDLETYRSEEYTQLYESEYTAACMALKEAYMEKLGSQTAFTGAGTEGLPAQLINSILLIGDRLRQDYDGLLGGISSINVSNVSLIEAWPGAEADFANLMYQVNYRLEASDPEAVILAGGMQYSDGWLTEQRYLVCDSYMGEPGSNHRVFSPLTIQENYAHGYYIKAYGNMYAAACAEAFNTVPRPVVLVSTPDNGMLEPCLMLKSSKTWSGYTDTGSWLMGDGRMLNKESIDSVSHNIPEIIFHPGLKIEVRNGYWGSPALYDSDFKALSFKAGDTVAPGEYYLVFPILGVKGRYISSMDQCEEASYNGIVKLIVEDAVAPHYILNSDSFSPDEPYFYFTGSAEALTELYAREIFPKQLMADEGDYAVSDYKLISCSLISVNDKGNYVSGKMKYAFLPENPELDYWWTEGTAEGQGNYEGMLVRECSFTLAGYIDGYWECISMDSESDGTYLMTLSGEVISQRLLKAMDTGDKDAFLELLALCPQELIPQERIAGDYLDMISEPAFGDEQAWRDLCIMKAYLVSDGAVSNHLGYTLARLYKDHEEGFVEVMNSMTENEIRIIDSALMFHLSEAE